MEPPAPPGAGVVVEGTYAGTMFNATNLMIKHGNSYRALVSELAAHVPPGVNCLANHNLGEPQRAMLEYFAGIVTYRDDTTIGKDCELVLVQISRRRVFTLDANEWQPVWNGSRPGDRHERLWLFQRRRAGAS